MSELFIEFLHKVCVKFVLPFSDCIEFEEQFEVDLIGQEVVLGCTLIVFEEGVVSAISFGFGDPFWLFLHVDVFGMKQLFEVFLFEFLEFRVGIFVAVFDALHPFSSLFFGGLDVVDATIVVALDFVFEIVGES